MAVGTGRSHRSVSITNTTVASANRSFLILLLDVVSHLSTIYSRFFLSIGTIPSLEKAEEDLGSTSMYCIAHPFKVLPVSSGTVWYQYSCIC